MRNRNLGEIMRLQSGAMILCFFSCAARRCTVSFLSRSCSEKRPNAGRFSSEDRGSDKEEKEGKENKEKIIERAQGNATKVETITQIAKALSL